MIMGMCCGAVVAASGVAAAAVGSPEDFPHPLVLAQVRSGPGSGAAAGSAKSDGPAAGVRSRIVHLRFQDGAAVSEDLTPGFAQAEHPEVSFDGRRMLFVGRRAEDATGAVWEMDLASREVRRIVTCRGECLAVRYLSRLFTLHAPEPWEQIAYIERDAAGVGALFTCRMDGNGVRRITYGVGGVDSVVALRNGRVLVGMETRTESAPGRENAPATALYTLNPDGTDLMAFTREMDRPVRRIGQGETDDGWVVFLETAIARGDKDGSILAVRGANSFGAPRALPITPDGSFRSATPWGRNHLMVSYCPRGGTLFGLFDFDLETGDTRQLYHDPDWDVVGVAVVRARPAPPGYSSVVRDDGAFGQLYCLDAYLTGLARESPAGPSRIESVRVYAAEPGRPGGAPAERRLGEVPLAEDGSFFLEVPARMPLRVETVGEYGATLRAMRNWFWVMPGERRGCIGCHEDRTLSPPNRHVKALYHAPRRLTLDRGAQVPTPEQPGEAAEP